MAQLAQHIENNECPKLDIDELQRARDAKALFSNNLIALTKEPVKNHFTDYMPSKLKRTTEQHYPGWDDLPPTEEDTRTVVGGERIDEDFPHLSGGPSQAGESAVTGASSVAGSTSASTAGSGYIPPHLANRPKTASANTSSSAMALDASNYPKPNEKPSAPVPAWTTEKNLFPDAPAPQRPTEQQLEAATAFNPNYRMWLEVDSPDHPHFNYARYWCKYSLQYTCPKTRCGKGFKKPAQLIGHLKGPAHGTVKYTCPACHKIFTSLQAISAHAESSSQHCHLRHTDGYAAYMDQISAGLVDVTFNNHKDGTHQLQTSVAAMKKYGDPEEAKKVEAARKAEQAKRDLEAQLAAKAKRDELLRQEDEQKKNKDFKAALEARDTEAERQQRARKQKENEGEYW